MKGAITIDPNDLPFLSPLRCEVLGKCEGMERSLLVAISIEKDDLQTLANNVIKLRKQQAKVIPMFPPQKRTA